MASLIGIIIGLLIGFVILAIFTLLFRWLWNTTIPEVFGLKSLDFWQAFKIMLISAMLFGGGTTILERGHETLPDEVTTQSGG